MEEAREAAREKSRGRAGEQERERMREAQRGREAEWQREEREESGGDREAGGKKEGRKREGPQTFYCTHLFYKIVLQTILGMGLGMNVTARNHCLATAEARTFFGAADVIEPACCGARRARQLRDARGVGQARDPWSEESWG